MSKSLNIGAVVRNVYFVCIKNWYAVNSNLFIEFKNIFVFRLHLFHCCSIPAANLYW